jgi:hypothetical protein
MTKYELHRGHSGFLLLEVMIGIAVFALFIGGVSYTLLYGQENTIMAGDRTRSVQYTMRALEATRAIRDGSFSSVTGGQHGVWIDLTSKKWAFSGSQITASGGYVSNVTVSTIASGWLRLTAQTKWKHGYNRSGSVLITSEITDWRSTSSIGDWSSPTAQGTYTDGGTPYFNTMAVYSGSYVFVSATAGNGLYIFDISNLSSPVRVNSSFSLGVGSYGVAVRGNILYVATADPSQEIRAYDISSPTTFGSSQLLGSYNVQGASRVRSIAVAGNTLYAGTVESGSAGEEEFYALRITSTGSISFLDSLNDDSSTVSMIAIAGTGAYLASSIDTGELRVVDVESGSNLQSLGGYNLSDRSLNGLAVAVSGTSALLGTQKGSSIQEVVLFDVTRNPIPSTPGPWYHEGSGSIVGIAMDPTRCYGFLSAQSGRKALQVFNMRDKSTLAELATYNSATGLGRGIYYDPAKDRVYLTTDRSFIIFSPGASTGSCP